MRYNYNNEETTQTKTYNTKLYGWLIGIALALIVGIYGFCQMLHCNDIQNIMIVQNIDGTIEVRREGGWFARVCPRIWEYPKASVEICNEGERDAIEMQFSNKTKAKLNCQIGYRIDSTNDDTVIRLHQQVEGSDDKIWKKVRTSLQTVAQCVASQYTPSESVEKFPEFAKKIFDTIVHEPNLLAEGIDVVSFTCAGLPEYDKETQAQFSKQKEADLAKRLAEAEKLKLESEKIRVEANYAMQISEQRGKAEAEMANQVQAAEKEKKLAEIAAQKQVAVQELQKQEMLIKAQKEKEVAEIEVQKQKEVAKIEAEKLREVAEIAKQTEAANLERVKLLAQQEIQKAEAKKISIEKSGAITELEKAKIDLELGKETVKWENIGKGISGIKLPQMMNIGTGGTNNANPLDTLIQTMTLEKLNQCIPQKTK